MTDTRKLAEEVLKDGYLMSLAVSDADGLWVADVIYVHDDALNVYWISMPTARHSSAIGEKAAVACSITAGEKKGDERGLQIAGTAVRLDGAPFELEKQHRRKRGMPEPTKAGETTEDGHVWYKLEPSRIELMYTKLFEYNRQRVL